MHTSLDIKLDESIFMDYEHQQYATINCKKVIKAKTVSLKLLDQKEEKTTFEKQPQYERSVALQQAKSFHQNNGFSYLGTSKNSAQKQKSFQEIMKESRKILEMKKKMQEEDERQRKTEKQTKKQKSKYKKQQKQQKKGKKGKKNQEKQQLKEEEIVLTSLDIERYQTEAISIKKIFEKIQFIQNLSHKCHIFWPIFSQLNPENDEHLNQQKSISMQKVFKEPQFIRNISTLEIQVELMKSNLERDIESKQCMTSFQIQELAKWQVQARRQNNGQNKLGSSEMIQKYTDTQNQNNYAQELEIELTHLENTFFCFL